MTTLNKEALDEAIARALCEHIELADDVYDDLSSSDKQHYMEMAAKARRALAEALPDVPDSHAKAYESSGLYYIQLKEFAHADS